MLRRESDADFSTKPRGGRHKVAGGYDGVIEPPIPASAPVAEYDADLDENGGPGSKGDLALLVLVLVIVLVDSTWFRLAGPVGELIKTTVCTLVGIGTFILPMLLGVVSILMMLDAMPRRERLTSTIIGAPPIVVGLLAIVHVDSGCSTDRQGRRATGGVIGGYVGSPLVVEFTSWAAVVLLLGIVLYDALVLSGATVRQLISATKEYSNFSE